MRRKKLFVIMMLSAMIGLTACGSSEMKTAESDVIEEATAVPQTEEEEEIVAEELDETESEEAVDETIVESTDAKDTIETENQVSQLEDMNAPLADGVFTEEEALAKVDRLIMAYEDLIKSNKEVEWNTLDRCERLESIGNIIPKTKDGFELNPNDNKGGYASFYVGVNYFYNYVNNNGLYYDFTEYIENHTLDEIFYTYSSESFIKEHTSNNVDSNYILFGEAIGCIPYIREFKLANQPIEVASFVEGEECSIGNVNDTEVFYELTLSLNGENSGLVVVFDKDGNMLNINTENAYDKFDYIFTFENSEEIVG